MFFSKQQKHIDLDLYMINQRSSNLNFKQTPAAPGTCDRRGFGGNCASWSAYQEHPKQILFKRIAFFIPPPQQKLFFWGKQNFMGALGSRTWSLFVKCVYLA